MRYPHSLLRLVFEYVARQYLQSSHTGRRSESRQAVADITSLSESSVRRGSQRRGSDASDASDTNGDSPKGWRRPVVSPSPPSSPKRERGQERERERDGRGDRANGYVDQSLTGREERRRQRKETEDEDEAVPSRGYAGQRGRDRLNEDERGTSDRDRRKSSRDGGRRERDRQRGGAVGRDRDRSTRDHSTRDRDRDQRRERDQGRDRDERRERDRDQGRERDRDRDQERGREGELTRGRDGEREREHERPASRGSQDESYSRDRSSQRHCSRSSRPRDRERDHDRELEIEEPLKSEQLKTTDRRRPSEYTDDQDAAPRERMPLPRETSTTAASLRKESLVRVSEPSTTRETEPTETITAETSTLAAVEPRREEQAEDCSSSSIPRDKATLRAHLREGNDSDSDCGLESPVQDLGSLMGSKTSSAVLSEVGRLHPSKRRTNGKKTNPLLAKMSKLLS